MTLKKNTVVVILNDDGEEEIVVLATDEKDGNVSVTFGIQTDNERTEEIASSRILRQFS